MKKTPVTMVVCLSHMFWTSYESCQRKQTGKVWLLSVFELSIMSLMLVNVTLFCNAVPLKDNFFFPHMTSFKHKSRFV